MQSIWPLLTGLILLFLVLAAGELLGDRKRKIRVASWGDRQENQILIDLINAFRKDHPQIQVELERFPFAEYAAGVLDAARRAEGHDVVFLEVTHFPDFYFSGILEPLGPRLRADRMDLDGYEPRVVGHFTVEGRCYAIPRDTAPICMVYYNKNAFDEAGLPYPRDDWDWDRFVETARGVTRTDAAGRVVRWGFVDGWGMLDPWVFGAGGSYVDDVHRPVRWTFATDPNTLRGVRFRWDLIHKHKVLPPPEVLSGKNDVDAAEMFVEGRAALYLSGLWKTPQFREIRSFRWDAALLPRGPGGGRGFATGGAGYGLRKDSRQKKAAWEFMKFISSEEGVRRQAAQGLSQPALRKVADSPVFLDGQDPGNKRMLLEAVRYGRYTPLCRNWSEVKRLIDLELEEVWKGNRTVERAMERLGPLLEKNPPVTR